MDWRHLLVAPLACSSLAAASFLPAVAAAEPNWYLGASVGQSRIDATTGEIDKAFLVDDGFVATNTKLDKTDSGWKGSLGYRFNRFLALEAGYADLGEATFSTTIVDVPPGSTGLPSTPFPIKATATADGAVLSAVLHLPLGDYVSVFAKAGAFRWQAEFTERISGTGITRVHRSEEQTDPAYGVGADVKLTEAVRARVEFERFKDVGKGIGGREGRDIDFALAGLVFAF
jgi:opacity protein-like surface antigen